MENMITGTRIPKQLAVDIKTPTGLVRTWHALGLYDWFIRANKTELRGMISSLSPEDRTRIIKLNTMYDMLRAVKAGFVRTRTIPGTGTQNNIGRTNRRRMNTFGEFITVLMVKLIMLWFLSVFVILLGSHVPSLPGVGGGLMWGIIRTHRIRTAIISKSVSFELKEIRAKIDRLGGLNLRNIHMIENIENRMSDPSGFPRLTGNNKIMWNAIKDKMVKTLPRQQGNYTEIKSL